MVILDNIIFSLQQHGGVSVLWGNLIEALNEQKISFKMTEYSNAIQNNKIRKAISNVTDKIIPLKGLVKIKRWINPKVQFSSPFIFHSSHYRICKNKRAINITTVHDFVYEYYRTGPSRWLHCWQKYTAIRSSDAIICISENTKKDLLKFIPDIEADKIRVIYNGVSEDYRPLSNLNSKCQNYLLFVGGRQNYKNFQFAVESAKAVNKKLLIVGSDISKDEETILDAILGNGNYRIVVHPDNNELNKLYNSVYALIYPSSYEGFGIPVIEAQKAGCPVIAMNSSSIPEIIGDYRLLLNKLDIEEFKTKIEYLNVQDNRISIINAGLENSKRFSWHKMTNEYLKLYHELLSSND